MLVFRIHFVWYIPSDALLVKPNAKYLTHFLMVLKKVLRKKNSYYDIIKKIVSLKVMANSSMILWWYNLSKV